MATAKAMVRKYFPEVAHCVEELETRDLPIFDDIVSDSAFKHTLRHAPYVSLRGRKQPGAAA